MAIVRQRWILLVAVLALAIALAGCGAATNSGSNAGQRGQPTALIVTRTGNPSDHIAPLLAASNDAVAVQRLYHAMYALPHVPSGAIFNCPADFGITYTLAFFNGGTQVSNVTADADGCQFLTLGPNDIRMTNDTFWSLLAQTAGIPPSSIHPAPAP